MTTETVTQPGSQKTGRWSTSLLSILLILLAGSGVIAAMLTGNSSLGLFSSLFLLMFIGAPVAISLGIASLFTIFYFTTSPLPDFAGQVFSGIDKFSLMAIPFFILAGNIFTTGGVARRLITLTNSWIGHIPGGLSVAGIISCGLFAAISGSSPATVVAIGGIMIPAMMQHGYGKNYAVGSITTSGSLGILIPPSIPMIVYAVTVQQSVGKMFIAGVIPGILLASLLSLVSYIIARKKNYQKSKKATWDDRWIALKDSLWSLSLPIVIIGGIYLGFFTPTESAAVAVVLGLIIGFFFHKDLRWRDMPGILVNSAKTTAMLFFIISMAMLFAHILTLQQIPVHITQWILNWHMGAAMFLLIVNILLFLAGQFMEPTGIITIMAPILFPVAMSLHIDPIHFGIIMVINMEMGMVTPPVGLNLYVASGLTDMSLTAVTRAVLPWLIAVVVGLILITYIPIISLWLPNLIM